MSVATAVTVLPRGERLARAVQRLGRALQLVEREVAVAHKVTVAQLRTLAVLTEGAATVSALAQAEGVAVSTMTRNLAVLERLGFLTRQDGAVDRRTVLAALTESGEALARDIAKATGARLSAAFGGFHPTEQVERAAAVDRVAAALERGP
jgi:DNA-binding MarR family transcriptional regulator